MDLPTETDDFIRESIEDSLGIPISSRTLRLKLLASQDDRRRLQDQIFALHDRLKDADKRLELSRAEASMNAQALRKCVEEKEVLASTYTEMVRHCDKLENECSLYERDLERIMDTCDELGKENEELKARLNENSEIMTLVAEVESLKRDKEHLRMNLCTAEEEVKVLYEDNKLLDEENKRLLRQLNKERHHHGSDSKHTASSSAKGKRKSRVKDSSPEHAIDYNRGDSPRQPLSPLQPNSPDLRLHKKQNGFTSTD
ncbi:hemagglutinin stalk domain-containing protein [Dioscorea alata]|uniref:Hemagglutinin stalk domain-containing protein n=1 Tax=Dioscorea alata TaxID=55571 RepID=A0ACB7WU67_DIOAL|nr:hemagglutinin stalk domain-containing protein [Dioscorea alata]